MKTRKQKWEENNCMDISSDKLARMHSKRPSREKEISAREISHDTRSGGGEESPRERQGSQQKGAEEESRHERSVSRSEQKGRVDRTGQLGG